MYVGSSQNFHTILANKSVRPWPVIRLKASVGIPFGPAGAFSHCILMSAPLIVYRCLSPSDSASYYYRCDLVSRLGLLGFFKMSSLSG